MPGSQEAGSAGRLTSIDAGTTKIFFWQFSQGNQKRSILTASQSEDGRQNGCLL
jgi:hypothetical protein